MSTFPNEFFQIELFKIHFATNYLPAAKELYPSYLTSYINVAMQRIVTRLEQNQNWVTDPDSYTSLLNFMKFLEYIEKVNFAYFHYNETNIFFHKLIWHFVTTYQFFVLRQRSIGFPDCPESSQEYLTFMLKKRPMFNAPLLMYVMDRLLPNFDLNEEGYINLSRWFEKCNFPHKKFRGILEYALNQFPRSEDIVLELIDLNLESNEDISNGKLDRLIQNVKYIVETDGFDKNRLLYDLAWIFKKNNLNQLKEYASKEINEDAPESFLLKALDIIPFYKESRRDILLSAQKIHEKNEMIYFALIHFEVQNIICPDPEDTCVHSERIYRLTRLLMNAYDKKFDNGFYAELINFLLDNNQEKLVYGMRHYIHGNDVEFWKLTIQGLLTNVLYLEEDSEKPRIIPPNTMKYMMAGIETAEPQTKNKKWLILIDILRNLLFVCPNAKTPKEDVRTFLIDLYKRAEKEHVPLDQQNYVDWIDCAERAYYESKTSSALDDYIYVMTEAMSRYPYVEHFWLEFLKYLLLNGYWEKANQMFTQAIIRFGERSIRLWHFFLSEAQIQFPFDIVKYLYLTATKSPCKNVARYFQRQFFVLLQRQPYEQLKGYYNALYPDKVLDERIHYDMFDIELARNNGKLNERTNFVLTFWESQFGDRDATLYVCKLHAIQRDSDLSMKEKLSEMEKVYCQVMTQIKSVDVKDDFYRHYLSYIQYIKSRPLDTKWTLRR
ncbi:hypothetical protein ABEB36_004687 [Hypothenemus hampei]|uniref:Uncharacterized protein n=1 Tax=Hypothenemus hampei TaxID=57062 RepID=A0ABD1F467_HYPHA